MKKFMLISLILLTLTACGEKTINDGMEILSDVENSIENNEKVSSSNVRLMDKVFDYYYENEVSESDKDLYVIFLGIKRDVEIYNQEIDDENLIAAEITKERIQTEIEKLK